MASERYKKPAKSMAQHYLNGLHIYCLLLRLKINKHTARKVVKIYENIVNPRLYS